MGSSAQNLNLLDLPQDAIERILFFTIPRTLRSLLVDFAPTSTAPEKCKLHHSNVVFVDRFSVFGRFSAPEISPCVGTTTLAPLLWFSEVCTKLRNTVASVVKYNLIELDPQSAFWKLPQWGFLTGGDIRAVRIEDLNSAEKNVFALLFKGLEDTCSNLESLELFCTIQGRSTQQHLNALLRKFAHSLRVLSIPCSRRSVQALQNVQFSKLEEVHIQEHSRRLTQTNEHVTGLLSFLAELCPDQPLSSVTKLRLKDRWSVPKSVFDHEQILQRLVPAVTELSILCKDDPCSFEGSVQDDSEAVEEEIVNDVLEDNILPAPGSDDGGPLIGILNHVHFAFGLDMHPRHSPNLAKVKDFVSLFKNLTTLQLRWRLRPEEISAIMKSCPKLDNFQIELLSDMAQYEEELEEQLEPNDGMEGPEAIVFSESRRGSYPPEVFDDFLRCIDGRLTCLSAPSGVVFTGQQLEAIGKSCNLSDLNLEVRPGQMQGLKQLFICQSPNLVRVEITLWVTQDDYLLVDSILQDALIATQNIQHLHISFNSLHSMITNESAQTTAYTWDRILVHMGPNLQTFNLTIQQIIKDRMSLYYASVHLMEVAAKHNKKLRSFDLNLGDSIRYSYFDGEGSSNNDDSSDDGEESEDVTISYCDLRNARRRMLSAKRALQKAAPLLGSIHLQQDDL